MRNTKCGMKVDFCLDKNLCFYKKIFSAEKINHHFELIIKSFPIIIDNFKKCVDKPEKQW